MNITDLPCFKAAALEQFNTSSQFPVPEGHKPWQIRNDYPTTTGLIDAPWLDIDPANNPEQYMAVIKKYCLEGMVESDFVPQNNKIRNWYHAPWMHWESTGREPLRGLFYERPGPPKETSATQLRTSQTWVVEFYNHKAATVLGHMWENPAKPKWDDHLSFPSGSIVTKFVFTTASDNDFPFLVGSPAWEAAIARQSSNQKPVPYARTVKPSRVRLLQLDFATKDRDSQTGWIFGCFMYNGLKGRTGWDGLMDVGLMWGNDPELTQAAFEAGRTVQESWVSQEAKELIASLQGERPSLGWNGRTNGAPDRFECSCLTCHQTSQWPPTGEPMIPPKPVRNYLGKFVPENDEETMRWFRNIRSGQTWNGRGHSGDTALLLQIGFRNFHDWKCEQEGTELPQEWKLHPRNGHALFSYMIG